MPACLIHETSQCRRQVPSLTVIQPSIGIRPTLVITLQAAPDWLHVISSSSADEDYSENYVNDYALQYGSLEIRPESTQPPVDLILVI